MHDAEVVAAIVAGDPDGLAEAYDKYASPLYAYCRSMLREPADAADAVQDTFVIAASKVSGLRDHDRLRPWLYAVARNECLRRLRVSSSEVSSALGEVPDVTDDSADVAGSAERAELRALLRSAVRGLGDADQDLIGLQLRQGLDAGEIAAVLGVSRNHAHALLSRARTQLETSLGALLVARTGREDCQALDAMLQDWDGELTVLMRKRINRHIERCPVCSERKRRELAPALLLGLAPLPLLVAPPGLKAEVMRLVSSNAPEAVAHRASVIQKAGSFGPNGFPEPVHPPTHPRWRANQTQAAAVGGAVAAVALGVALALSLSGGVAPHHGTTAAGPGATGSIGSPGSPGFPGAGLPPGGSGTHPGGRNTSPSVVPAHPVVHVSPVPAPDSPPSPGSGNGSGPPGSGGSPGSGGPPGSSPPSTSPAPGHSSTSPGIPAPSTSSTTPAPPRTTPPPPPPPPGTLTVSPRSILLSPVLGASITLTASGGPVSWSIAESGSLLGHVAVSPSSGTLAAGQSVTVSIRVTTLVSLASSLTVNPGGIGVSVAIGLGL